MKREILFRGKRIDNREWIYGTPFFINEENFVSILTNCQTANFKDSQTEYTGYQVIPDTVGQFTGLTDKNGNKIYEGDIAKPLGNIYNRQRYLIKWDNPTARFLFFRYIDDDIAKGIQSVGYHYTYTKLVNDLEIEIIGNIHDKSNM